jgi:DNA-binding NarL/FixJ family response regulator
MLVEDQAMVRQGLRYIIDAQPGLTVVGEAEDGEEAIQAALAKNPDVILMDIRMPGKNGIDATREILQTLPGTKIILLTTFDIQEYVYEGIRAGAVGYLLKSAETQALFDGIRDAYQGAVIYRSTTSGEAIAQAFENGGRIPSR